MMHFHDRLVPGATLDMLLKIRLEVPGRGAHTLTGPIYVEGAEPGDVLKVKINRIVPRSYGVNMNYPGIAGQFPKEFPEGRVRYVYLDWDNKVAEFLPGVFIPLRPFPGILGVARAEPGRYSTVPPGRYGGNLDLRELTAGSTLYVPVFVMGERCACRARQWRDKPHGHRDRVQGVQHHRRRDQGPIARMAPRGDADALAHPRLR
jgi:acetamidase/formamidase